MGKEYVPWLVITDKTKTGATMMQIGFVETDHGDEMLMFLGKRKRRSLFSDRLEDESLVESYEVLWRGSIYRIKKRALKYLTDVSK